MSEEASAEFSKPLFGDRFRLDGVPRLNKPQQEALIRIMASVRNDGRLSGAPQLPGPGLQRRPTSSWEVFNAGRKKN